MADRVTVNVPGFIGGVRLDLSGLTYAPFGPGTKPVASLTVTDDYSTNPFTWNIALAGVLVDSGNVVRVLLGPGSVAVGPAANAIKPFQSVGVDLPGQGLVPASLAGQTVTLYAGLQGAFQGLAVGFPYTPSQNVISTTATLGGASGGGGGGSSGGGGGTGGGGSGSAGGGGSGTSSNTAKDLLIGAGIVFVAILVGDAALKKRG